MVKNNLDINIIIALFFMILNLKGYNLIAWTLAGITFAVYIVLAVREHQAAKHE